MPKTATVKKREFASDDERTAFILSNAGLGVCIANQCAASVGHHGLEFEDLIQAAWLAIVRSSDYYDPAHRHHRVGFDNYAFLGTRREVQRAAINQVNAVVVGDSPFTKKSRSVRSKKMSKSLSAARQARTAHLDFQPASQACPPDEMAERSEHIRMIGDALVALPARERWIVMASHGIGCDEQTLADIGKQMGISRQRVQQLKVQAMARLRESLKHIGDDL